MDDIWTWGVITLIVMAGVGWGLARTCSCGRERRWFFDRRHPRIGWFYVKGFVELISAFYTLFSDNGLTFFVVGWVFFFIMTVFAIYYHEKDKLKRAAKALGRVAVGHTGRLIIVKE